MPVAFAERHPTPGELERFRLILSTYQDGTGMLVNKQVPTRTLPGWRDFERAVALAFNGIAGEDKAIFDVKIPDPLRLGVSFGVSCKMKDALDQIERSHRKLGGRAYMELSNSNKKFWDALSAEGIYQRNFKSCPELVGSILLDLVRSWHSIEGLDSGGDVDLGHSCYLTLSYNKLGWYQLHQFSLELPDPRGLTWEFPTASERGAAVSNTLHGIDSNGRVLEWYSGSGGQLKYYPEAKNALWQSDKFRLQPLPGDIENGIMAKAKEYFTDLWPTD